MCIPAVVSDDSEMQPPLAMALMLHCHRVCRSTTPPAEMDYDFGVATWIETNV
jgi:hypothetical protein